MKNDTVTKENNTLPLLKLISSMLVFGTVGLVVRGVSFPSGFIAMVRGFVGAAVILLMVRILAKRGIDLGAIKKNIKLLIASGVFIGINWILLFESYRYTTVATATLCYYMAPVFVVIASPFLLGAKVGLAKWGCALAALCGMVLVSEPWSSISAEGGGNKGLLGIIFALGAALFYAGVTILNKKMKEIESYDMTFAQLLVAAIVILPYTLIAEDVTPQMFDVTSVVLLLVLGVVHTGISYTLFFGSVKSLPADKVAIFSYIDPIVAVLLSALFLGEPMTVFGIAGAVLIIISTLASELIDLKKR